jgi:homoserine dehydrogenase
MLNFQENHITIILNIFNLLTGINDHLRLILIGFGVVGQDLIKLFLSRASDLYSSFGLKPRIVAVADKLGVVSAPEGLDLQKLLNTKRISKSVVYYDKNRSQKNVMETIEETEAEVLIELTPTNIANGEPGITHIISGMKSGKHVITVNKGPLALEFPSLIELAEYNQVAFRFSGTVGGGTPVLDFAKRCLKGDRILSFEGILNGTTNYILSKMGEGLSFSDALIDATAMGYAERDPILDIEGFDAAAKLVIIANWVMGMKVTIKDVGRKGIKNLVMSDIRRATREDSAIKLLAACDGKNMTVGPRSISKKDPLCVNGTLNAITFTSEHSGKQTIIGRGAGGIETASSIIRDLIEIRNTISFT